MSPCAGRHRRSCSRLAAPPFSRSGTTSEAGSGLLTRVWADASAAGSQLCSHLTA